MLTVDEVFQEETNLEEMEESPNECQGVGPAAVSPEEAAWLAQRRGKITGSNVSLLMGSTSPDEVRAIEAQIENAIVIPPEVLSGGARRGSDWKNWKEQQPEGAELLKREEREALDAKLARALERLNGFSEQGKHYLRRLIAEQLGSSYSFDSPSVQWGREFEPEAIRVYEQVTGFQVDSTPFQFSEYRNSDSVLDGMAGSTPDGRVIGKRGRIEVKCPKDPAFHIATAESGKIPTSSGHNYVPQCDSHILFAPEDDRVDWCDYVSFDPRMPESEPSRIVIIRRHRDEGVLSQLHYRCELAADWMTRAMMRLHSRQVKGQFTQLANQLGVLTKDDRAEVFRLLGADDIPF